jgi:hypothetical protein
LAGQQRQRCGVIGGDLYREAPLFTGQLNLGWELPGIFDVEMEVNDLSIRAAMRPPVAGR